MSAGRLGPGGWILIVGLVACGKQDGALPTKTPTATATKPKPASEVGDGAPTLIGAGARRARMPAARRLIGRWTPDEAELKAKAFSGLDEGDWLEAQAMLKDLSFDFAEKNALTVRLGGRTLAGQWSTAPRGAEQALRMRLAGGEEEEVRLRFVDDDDEIQLDSKRWPSLRLRRVRRGLAQ